MDLTAALPIIGTLLGVGVGVLLNSGSEHRKWLRSERHKAYMDVVDAMRAHRPTTKDEKARDSTIKSLMHVCRRAELLAPTSVRYAMIRLMAYAVSDRSGQDYRETLGEVLEEMRKDLRINQRSFREKVVYRYYRLRHPIKTRSIKPTDNYASES